MKLAIVTHNLIRGDGQGRVNYELTRHALKQGVPVWLVADRVDPELQQLGAVWVPIHPRQRKANLLKVAQFARQATYALDDLAGQVDIVHGNGYTLRRPHQVNSAHLVHGAWKQSPVHTARLRRDLYGAYQWTYTTLNARWERQAYAQAERVVAVSERVRQELIGIGVPDGRIRVILNGVDTEEFRPGPADRSVLGLPIGVPLLLFAGDIRTPRKNLDTVLKALVHIPGIHLAVVGAVANSPYPRLAASLGITDRVHFLDFRRDVAEIMRAADAFVFPSRYEACSLVLLEALASGLPIVTAVTAGGAEVVTSDCGVVLPDPNDTAALTRVLCALLDDGPRRAAMRDAARDVAERHRWTDMADQYLQLYHEVAA